MKYWILLLVILGLIAVKADNRNQHGAEIEDNEFAEFEDFDDGEDSSKEEQPSDSENTDASEFQTDEFPQDEGSEDAVVETEEEDFDTLDPDEFEGLPGDDTIWENENSKIKVKKNKGQSEPELKIADVPLHLRSWDKYYLEILMGLGLAVYLLNFFIGKSKNSGIASLWFRMHKEFLLKQFDLVGDDPNNPAPESTEQLIKESEHTYTLWCSGRQCCEGMLVELKLQKRQDLISLIANRLKPTNDKATITVTMSDMDTYVLCVGTKKSVNNLHKTMQDVSLFCTEKSRPGDKYGLSPSLTVLSELYGDLPSTLLNDKVVKVLNENLAVFESLHISDQFTGPQPLDQDEQTAKRPDAQKIITLTLNMPSNRRDSGDMTQLLPLLKMVVYLIDRVRKYKLPRDSKAKADKHRQDALAKFMKQTHAQRQEAAQLKKEEKARALKDKMMNEEDPEKQRKLDEMIHRRELNKKNKKMMKGRQYKVKAM